jgi:hypothetical protein
VENLGVERASGRAISFGLLDDAWQLPADCPSWFGLFIAADATSVSTERIGVLAEQALTRKCAYVSTWGPDCEAVHDTFDDIYVDREQRGLSDPFLMSTWHNKESLPSALWFALTIAYPTHVDEDREWPFVALSQRPWHDEVRVLLLDQERLDALSD